MPNIQDRQMAQTVIKNRKGQKRKTWISAKSREDDTEGNRPQKVCPSHALGKALS